MLAGVEVWETCGKGVCCGWMWKVYVADLEGFYNVETLGCALVGFDLICLQWNWWWMTQRQQKLRRKSTGMLQKRLKKLYQIWCECLDDYRYYYEILLSPFFYVETLSETHPWENLMWEESVMRKHVWFGKHTKNYKRTWDCGCYTAADLNP